MGNKKSKKTRNKREQKPRILIEDEVLINKELLPQNILQIGDRDDKDKVIYIYQNTYKKIHDFTKDKTDDESGGILMGNIVKEFGKIYIIAKGFIEAKFCEATPTTLTFTHETWDYIHDIADEQFPNQIIVGWIHTHPNFGIFLSEYDKFIHQNFFNGENQIAYVVDPIQNIEGFYTWIGEEITKCNGFYIFDKTGVDIESPEDKKTEETNNVNRNGSFEKIALIGLSIAVIFLAFFVVTLNGRINTLQSQQNQAFSAFQQNDMYFQQEISNIEAQLAPIEEPNEDTTDITTEDQTTEITDDNLENTTKSSPQDATEQEESSKSTTNTVAENTSMPNNNTSQKDM